MAKNASEFVSRTSLSTLLVIAESLLSDEGREKAIKEYNGESE